MLASIQNQKLNQRITDAMPWQAVEKAMSRLIDTFFKAGKLPIGLQLWFPETGSDCRLHNRPDR